MVSTVSTSCFHPKVFRVTSLGRVTRKNIPTITKEDWKTYLMALRAMLNLPDSPTSKFDTRTLDAALNYLIARSDSISDDENGITQINSAIHLLSIACNDDQSTENVAIILESGSLFYSLRNMEDLVDFLRIFSNPYTLGPFTWTTHSTYTLYGTPDDVEAEIHKFKQTVTRGGICSKDGTNSDVAKISKSKSKADTCRSRFSIADYLAKIKRASVSDHAKAKRKSVSDDGKVQSKGVSDYATVTTNESVLDHTKVQSVKSTSVSDHAKVTRESVSDHAKVMKSLTNTAVSTVANTDAYGEYFKYRYDEKSSKNASKENDVESVSKAIRAVNIQIAVCDSTTTKSRTRSRSAYDDMSDDANYYKYRYDDKQITGHSDITFETESNSTQDRYESFRGDNAHYVVDHHNETIAEFDPDAYAPDRYEHVVENDTAYVVDHYNQEVYEDIGCDEEECNSYFDHSSLDNYEYYTTDDDSHGEESY